MGTILCLGNSNTYGYDPRSYLGGSYPEDVRWTGLLRKAGWEILNRGQNGREIPTEERQFDAYVEMIQRETTLDLVTVMLGTNDLLMHPCFTAEDVTQRMGAFLSHLIAHVPDTRFLLIAPPPMRPGEWVGEERLLAESVRLGMCYAALAGRLSIASADAGAWSVEMTFDGVHFSPAGHRTFAVGIANILKELFP